MLQTRQEPLIDLGQLLDAINGVAFLQGLCNGKDAQVGGILKGIVEVVEADVVVANEAVHALSNHAKALLNHFFEGATDRHDLANRLHG